MKPIKHSTIFFTTLFFTVINVIIVILFSHEITTSVYTAAAIGWTALEILHIVLACALKRRGNYLSLNWSRISTRLFFSLFEENEKYTYTESYEKRFRFMLLVHCIMLTFNIPAIFLAEDLGKFLLCVVISVVTGVIDLTYYYFMTLDESKRRKFEQEQLERERIEQERRESEGKWR